MDWDVLSTDWSEPLRPRCSRCPEFARIGQRLCNSCHAANMRAVRKVKPTPYDQRVKARAHANVAVRRGQLKPEPCKVCGSSESLEKHHSDYGRPLEVEWYCRKHHLFHHLGPRLVAYDVAVGRET